MGLLCVGTVLRHAVAAIVAQVHVPFALSHYS